MVNVENSLVRNFTLFQKHVYFIPWYRQSVLGNTMVGEGRRAGHLAQSVGRLTHEPEIRGSIPGPATYFVSPSTDSRRAVVSFWRKYVHEVLVNRLGGLSLPRKSVVRLTDCPDITIDIYR